MILQTILEGLGVLLVLVYASGIRKSSVVMVHLYHEDVQPLPACTSGMMRILLPAVNS